MSHTLVLNLSDEAWEELARAASEKSQSPESIASNMLNDSLPDPLLKLSGAIKSRVTDIAARHDEYIGEELQSNHSR